MKNNILRLIIVLVISILLLSGCYSSRYAQGDRQDRRNAHHHGVDNRNYRGY